MSSASLNSRDAQTSETASARRRPCRSCGAELKHTFIDLGMSPLANSNVESGKRDRMEPFYPLHAYVCHECFLVQLEEFETPQHIFSDYAYLSSFSESWVQHARRYVDMIVGRLALGPVNDPRDREVRESEPKRGRGDFGSPVHAARASRWRSIDRKSVV